MLFLHPKAQKSIVGAAGSGFEHLVSLVDIKLGSTRTGMQFRPNVDGDTFTKDSQFARGDGLVQARPSALAHRVAELQTPHRHSRRNAHSRWLILAIKAI